MSSSKRNNIIIIALLLLIMPFSAVESNAEKVFRYSKENPVVIEGDWDFPPYEYLDDQGTPQGYSIELMTNLLNRLKIPYVIRLKGWQDVLKDLATHKADLACGVYIKQQASNLVHGKALICLLYQDMATRDNCPHIKSLKELGKRRVVVQKYDLSYFYMIDNGYSRNMIVVNDINDALKKLSRGKYDMALWSHYAITNTVKKYRLSNVQWKDIGIPPFNYHFISHDQNLINTLDRLYIQLKLSGDLDYLDNKWFHPNNHSASIKYTVYMAIGILIILIAMLYILNSILRSKVRKTNDLIKKQYYVLSLAVKSNEVKVWGYDVNKDLVYNIEGECVPKDGISYSEGRGMFHPDDYDKFDIMFKKVLSGEINEGYINVRLKNGEDDKEWHNIEKIFVAAHKTDGKIDSIIGTHRDITSSVIEERDEKALLEKYETIFNSAMVGLSFYDKDGVIVDMNDMACRIFDITDKQKVIDSKVSLFDCDFLNGCIDPNNIKPFNGVIKFDHIQIPDTVDRLGIKRKNIGYINISIKPIYDENNDLLYFILSSMDVTEEHQATMDIIENNRKAQETMDNIKQYDSRIKNVLETTGMQIWAMDFKTKKMTFSHNAIDKGIELELEDYFNKFDASSMDDVKANIEKAFKGKLGEFSVLRKFKKTNDDERERYAIISGVPIKDDKDKVIGYFGLLRDVTDTIYAEKKLEEETQKAQEADEMKSEFLSNMSHEIRTPLNAIVGFSELLQNIDNNDEIDYFTSIINNNNDVLMQLINDILELSRLDANIVTFKPVSINFAESFHDSFESLKRHYKGNVNLIEENPYISCIMTIDYNHVIQVITQFAYNAFKYTENGYIKIGYSLENEGIKIYVEDSGIGIAKEKCDKIFDRFVKLNDFSQGTGLGLSICKATVEQYHGRIGVTSNIGKGTYIWAWFPCEIDNAN